MEVQSIINTECWVDIIDFMRTKYIQRKKESSTSLSQRTLHFLCDRCLETYSENPGLLCEPGAHCLFMELWGQVPLMSLQPPCSWL